MSGVPQIFDARLRRRRRARAARAFDAFSFLASAARDEIAERLAVFDQPLSLGVWNGAIAPPAAPSIAWIHGDSVARFVPRGGVVFDEAQLPFAQGTLDVYAAVLTLHTVNDLPGALSQIRGALKPGGLFLAAMLGGRTLHELRVALTEAEAEVEGGVSPRVAPFVDTPDAGALLQRAGFALPVADVDSVTVHYEHPLKLFADLRGMGETNVLNDRRRTFLKRSVLGRACALYAEKFGGTDGRVPATFDLLYLTGRA